MSNPKLHWKHIFASGPSILAFAKVAAAKGCECQNRTTRIVSQSGFATQRPAMPGAGSVPHRHDLHHGHSREHERNEKREMSCAHPGVPGPPGFRSEKIF